MSIKGPGVGAETQLKTTDLIACFFADCLGPNFMMVAQNSVGEYKFNSLRSVSFAKTKWSELQSTVIGAHKFHGGDQLVL